MSRFKRLLLVLAASLALVAPGLVVAGPADAAIHTVTLSGACTTNIGQQMFVKQVVEVRTAPDGNVTHFGAMDIFYTPAGFEKRATLRHHNEVVWAGPASFLGASPIHYDWNNGYAPSSDQPYLRVYFYSGTGCNVTLRAPAS